MESAAIFWWAVLWMLVWGTVGGVATPRFYVRRDRDVSRATLVGSTLGAATGPFGLVPLWQRTPELSARWALVSILLVVALFVSAFAAGHPDNICVASGDYVLSQLANGLVMGTIYGLMALGLALIFSILGVVSFAHGEFYIIGGMVVCYTTAVWFPGLHPLLAVASACLTTFVIGGAFERIFLSPMYKGLVERPVEYAILITFGLAFFLQYFVMALAGANPVKAQRFFDFPIIRFPSAEDPWLVRTSAGNLTLFEIVSISDPRFTAALISVLMLVLIVLFLYRTWPGEARLLVLPPVIDASPLSLPIPC